MGMKLLPCNFSNLIFLPQCIKQPANCQAAYFPIWNNFCCDNICVYFLELGSLAKRTKTKRKKKNPLSGQCSVLKTKQSSLIFFGYLLHHHSTCEQRPTRPNNLKIRPLCNSVTHKFRNNSVTFLKRQIITRIYCNQFSLLNMHVLQITKPRSCFV